MSQWQASSPVPGLKNAFQERLPRFTQDISTQLVLPKTDEELIDLIPQLLVYLNETFPRHYGGASGATQFNLQDGAGHANLLFGALESVLQRIDSPCTAIPKHQKNNLAQFVIGGLTGFDLVLASSQPEVRDEPPDIVQTLKRRAFNIVVTMLRRFSQSGSETSRASWEELRSLYTDICQCIQSLVHPLSPLSFPCTPGLFENGQRQTSVTQNTALPFYPCGGASLTNSTDVIHYCTILLKLCVESLTLPVAAMPYLQGIPRLVSQSLCYLFDYCLSSPLRATPLEKRIIYAARIYELACKFIDQSESSPLAGNFAYRILLCRLEVSEATSWDMADTVLAQIFTLPFAIPPNEGDTGAILDLLADREWQPDPSPFKLVIINFLRLNTQRTNKVSTQMALLFERLGTRVELPDNRDAVEGQSNPPNQCPSPQRPGSPILWRTQVETLTSAIIGSDLDWMDDGSSQNKFAQRAIREVVPLLHSGMKNSDTSTQAKVVENLIPLICLLAHPNDETCKRATSVRCVLPADALSTLLRDEGVSTTVKRKGFSVIAQLLRHHPLQPLGEQNDLVDLVVFGLKFSDRMARLKAGDAVKALVELYELLPEGQALIHSLFGQHLYKVMDNSPVPVQETLLLSTATVAKDATRITLGLCIQLLFAYLCSRNPVVRSISYTQILAIVKYRGKSGLAVLSPYFRHLVPFAVSRLFSHPMLLNDLCFIVSMPPSGLLKQTARDTLPLLIQNCNLKVLKKVCEQIGDEESTLAGVVFQYMHHILAHILLIPDTADFERTERFLLDILYEGSGGKQIHMDALIKSCQTPLLADLLLIMGHENPERAKLSSMALHRVEKYLHPPTKKRKQTQVDNLVAMINAHLLGIATNFNEILYETKGRESVEAKRRVLRALGELSRIMGDNMSAVQSQIMASFQNTINDPQLAEATLESWHSFLSALSAEDIGRHLAATSSSFIAAWPSLSPEAQQLVGKIMIFLVHDKGSELKQYLGEIADFQSIPLPAEVQRPLDRLKRDRTVQGQLEHLLAGISNENIAVSAQSLREMRAFLLNREDRSIEELLGGDLFDPLIGQTVGALLSVACRDSEGSDKTLPLAFECLGILGAVDPHRCDVHLKRPRIMVQKNFEDLGECQEFAAHLIRDLLAGAYKSTSDTRYQTYLAFAIQELCKVCGFKTSVAAEGSTSSPAGIKARRIWRDMPPDVTHTVVPLLEGRYNLLDTKLPPYEGPIYPRQPTYREWIQRWVSHLVTRVAGENAQRIFRCFQTAICYKDAIVSLQLLPHLVLTVLISGNEEDVEGIRSEILLVLEDQLDEKSNSTPDKQRLSAQAIFTVFDHLSQWVRIQSSLVKTGKNSKRRSGATKEEERLMLVESILSSIKPRVMAKAALQCKADARALMNFERHILELKAHSPQSKDIAECYEQLHRIYANLDEPDAMEGVSTLILAPSLEHQIRQHESSGRWTSAQSCWEVQLQQSPDNVDFHLGLLRCLRNLGHHDTLRTHVAGLLTRHPSWASALADFQVESAWLVGAWDDVSQIVQSTEANTAAVNMAKILLALRTKKKETIYQTIQEARQALGSKITLSGARGYRQAYDTVLDLHLTYELELIGTTLATTKSSQSKDRIQQLSEDLSARLACLPPSFRIRESVLSLRRTALSIFQHEHNELNGIVGDSWVTSAKLARKAGQWQTAYSAVLQADRYRVFSSFLQHVKLIKCTGEPVRALQELSNSLKLHSLTETVVIDHGNNVIELEEKSVVKRSKTKSGSDQATERLKAKAALLRARWMNELARYESSQVMSIFKEVVNISPKWESGYYHLGYFHDQCYKELPKAEKDSRGIRMQYQTVKAFSKAAKHGVKHIFQTVPRMLTIWLDSGENPRLMGLEQFASINKIMQDAINEVAASRWFIAFPQIASRIGHKNSEVFKALALLIMKVLRTYPKQAIWTFISTINSSDRTRRERGGDIFKELIKEQNQDLTNLVMSATEMATTLIEFCDHNFREGQTWKFKISKDFPKILKHRNTPLLVPLQESLTATLPPASSDDSTFQPFPIDAPTIQDYRDEVEVMKSLARPRKICLVGSDGKEYVFLGKPKDDLRKDARLMDLFSMINKFFKSNSDSRRRQLHIRTYGVVTMNEQCGFIQWVPNTICLRPALASCYEPRGIATYDQDMIKLFPVLKAARDKEAAGIFLNQILPKYPPVFHEWFIESFPEPTQWLSSRLAYGRTAAVMSMVGFILGLGDRHSENILLDTSNGDVVHVDFNCLFEKGRALEVPERVPFRLTHNMIDGLGVSGVEGVFRIACEITLKILREHGDSLMSVLDAFIHDPLVEWADERRRLEMARRNQVKSSADLRLLAQSSLGPIEKKLKGVYTSYYTKVEKEMTEGQMVQTLIHDATDPCNLGKMYNGWAAWY